MFNAMTFFPKGIRSNKFENPFQEWKAGQGQMGLLTPKYQPEADLSGQTVPRLPALKICNMDASGNLEIPQDIRDKWISDPVRSASLCPLFKSVCFLVCLLMT